MKCINTNNKTKKTLLIGGILLVVVMAIFFIARDSTNITGAPVINIDDPSNEQNMIQDMKTLQDTITPQENQAADTLLEESDEQNITTLGTTKRRGGGGSSSGSSSSSSDSQEVAWEEVYSYSDEYSEGGFTIDTQNNEIEVSRAYAWKAEFGTLFNGIIQVVSSNDKYSWYGSRLALVNPDNTLERYEVRLLPGEDKLEVRYVDRTNRTGTLSGIDTETISEQLAVTNCNIDTGLWYDINIINLDSVWKAQLLSLTNPTCFVEWEDSRISADKYGLGIQSAGKYVTSRFDAIIAK